MMAIGEPTIAATVPLKRRNRSRSPFDVWGDESRTLLLPLAPAGVRPLGSVGFIAAYASRFLPIPLPKHPEFPYTRICQFWQRPFGKCRGMAAGVMFAFSAV